MATITKTFTFSSGATIVAAEHNTNFDTLYNEFNGNIDNTNIKASAAIVDTKLAQITTASKVSGAALTTFSSIPSGAGYIPLNNITGLVTTGANSTITSITGLTTPLAINQGGTASTTANAALNALLPAQAGNVNKFLTTNGTNTSWNAVGTGSFSNVIFSWSGCDQAVVNASGIFSGSSTNPDLQTFPNPFLFMGRSAATYKTIIQGQWTKIAGVSTVTIHAKLWADTADPSKEALLKVDIGGQNNIVKSVTSTTPNWVTTSTIDVSGLINGTVYTIDILMANETAINSSYCSGIMLIGS